MNKIIIIPTDRKPTRPLIIAGIILVAEIIGGTVGMVTLTKWICERCL